MSLSVGEVEQILVRQRRRGFDWILFVAVAVLMEWPVISHPEARVIGGYPDAFQYVWYLGWFWHAVLHGYNPLFSNEINYPIGIQFMSNTSALAESVLFGWFGYFTNLVFVYNLVVFLNIVVIGIFGSRVLSAVGVSRWISLWGATMFCFMPYLTAQELGHLSQFVVAPLFVILYIIIRSLQDGAKMSAGRSIALTVLFAFVFYSSLELFATAYLAAIILLVCLFLQSEGRIILKGVATRIPVASWFTLILGTLVLISPGLLNLASTGGLAMAHTAVHPNAGMIWVSDFLSPWIPTQLQLVHFPHAEMWTSLFRAGLEEQGGYIGVFIIAMAVSVRKSWRSPVARSLIILILIMFLLSMGDKLQIFGLITPIPLPWTILSHLPFLGSAIPARLAIYVDIGLILWITISLEKLRSQLRNGLPLWVVAAMMIGLVTWIPFPDYPSEPTYTLPSAVRHQIGSQPVYFITPNFSYELQPLAATGYTVNAYNTYGVTQTAIVDVPSRYPLDLYMYPFNQAPDTNTWVEEIRHLIAIMPQGYIIITPDNPRGVDMPQTLQRAIQTVLGPPTSQVDGVQLWNVQHLHLIAK